MQRVLEQRFACGLRIRGSDLNGQNTSAIGEDGRLMRRNEDFDAR